MTQAIYFICSAKSNFYFLTTRKVEIYWKFIKNMFFTLVNNNRDQHVNSLLFRYTYYTKNKMNTQT